MLNFKCEIKFYFILHLACLMIFKIKKIKDIKVGIVDEIDLHKTRSRSGQVPAKSRVNKKKNLPHVLYLFTYPNKIRNE